MHFANATKVVEVLNDGVISGHLGGLRRPDSSYFRNYRFYLNEMRLI
jgi:hypothetical protein